MKFSNFDLCSLGFVRNLVEFCECRSLHNMLYRTSELRDWRCIYDQLDITYDSDSTEEEMAV